MRRATWVVARVVSHGPGDDEDQAGAGMGVPPNGRTERELVVDDVDVGSPVGLELGLPEVGGTGAGVDMDVSED
jgi:hypothetical protein